MIGSNKQIWNPTHISSLEIIADPNRFEGVPSNWSDLYNNGYTLTKGTNSMTKLNDGKGLYYWDVDGITNSTDTVLTSDSASSWETVFNGNFSMFFRVRFDSPATNSVICGWRLTNTNTFALFYINTGDVNFRVLYTSGASYDIRAETTSNPISADTWHNIVLTRNGNTITWYIDGVAQTTSYTNQSQISTFCSATQLVSQSGLAGIWYRTSSMTSSRNPLTGDGGAYLLYSKELSQNEIDLLNVYYQ